MEPALFSLTEALEQAVKKDGRGDRDAARQGYQDVLLQDPTNFEALRLLGDLERRTGNHAAAADAFRRALRIVPDSADLHERLGRVLARIGENKAALRAYQRALDADPGYAQTYVSLARVFLRNGKMEQARKSCERARELDPANADTHFLLGAIHWRHRQIEAATAAFLSTLRLQPDLHAAHKYLARIFANQGQPRNAREHLQKYLLHNPDDAPAYVALAEVAVELGEIDEAMRHCQRALQIDPRSAAAMAQIGRIHVGQHQLATAQRSFAAALNLEPGFEPAIAGMAELLETQGNFANALRTMRSIGTAAHHDVRSVLVFARLLRHDGRHDEAIALIKDRLNGRRDPAAGRRQLYFALGALCEDESAYEAAFVNFQNANDLRRAEFDGADLVRRTNSLIEFFDPERISSLPRSRSAHRPVLLVGLPESGKQLIGQMLVNHPAVTPLVASQDLDAFANGLSAGLGSGKDYPACLVDTRRADLDQLADKYCSDIALDDVASIRTLNDDQQNMLHIGLAVLLFPEVRVICCTRDPRDQALACYFSDYQGADNNFTYSLTDIGLYLREQWRLVTHWKSCADLPILDVRYEKVLANPVFELERLLAFLRLTWSDQCMRFREPTMTGGRPAFHTPLCDASVGRHRHYAAYTNAFTVALRGARA